MTEFVHRNDGGCTLDGKGFRISYQPAANTISPEHPDGETALIIDDDTQTFGHVMLILNGNWCEEYARVADQGVDACRKVYEANKRHRSKWSEDEPYEPSMQETNEIFTKMLGI